MRFHASHERACRTAKRLRDVANAHVRAGRPILLSDAQRALAAAWGYSSWTELLHACEGAPRSPLDEDADASVAAGRAEAHADALASSLDVDLPLARAIVADAGLTARTPPARPLPPGAARDTPGPSDPARPRGLLLGHDAATGEEVRLSHARARRHVAVHGGDPKSRAAFGLGLTAQYVAGGAACIHVHAGESDAAALARVQAAARATGRLGDVVVLDLRGDGADWPATGDGPALNPFATGDADALVRFMRDLAGPPYDEYDSDAPPNETSIWAGWTLAMVQAVMRALVALRDAGLIDLDAGAVRDHLELRRVIGLADEAMFPELPPEVRDGVRAYLTSLPGFQPARGHRQAQTTLDHHGILGMAFAVPLGRLAEVHWATFVHLPWDSFDARPHVEVADIVSNRRILFVALPDRDDPLHREYVSRAVLALIRRAMRQLSGDEVDPRWAEAVRRGPPGRGVACSVHFDGFDTYGSALPDGMGDAARSLGWSLTLSQGAVGGEGGPGGSQGGIVMTGTTVLIGDGTATDRVDGGATVSGKGPDGSGTPGFGEAHVMIGDAPARQVRLAG